jgi:hypothetical protein
MRQAALARCRVGASCGPSSTLDPMACPCTMKARSGRRDRDPTCQLPHASALLRNAATLLGALLLVPLLTACPKGDVGASLQPRRRAAAGQQGGHVPGAELQRPALRVYADSSKAPDDPCTRRRDVQTRPTGEQNRFQCHSGNCKLSSTYVLERSMCSRTCARPTTTARTAASARRSRPRRATATPGFSCTEIQKLGEFCCRKLCVCKRRPRPRLARHPQEGVRGLRQGPENGDPVCEMVGDPPVHDRAMATAPPQRRHHM